MKNTRYYIFALIFLSVMFYGKVSSANIESAEYIKVKLTKPFNKSDVVSLESTTGFSIYDESDKINSIYIIKENNIKASIDKLKNIILSDMENNMLYIIPKDNNLLLSSTDTDGKLIKIEKSKYRGYISLDSDGLRIRLINHVKVEDYLYGVVPSEMPAGFPIEALKAQAVAARTYAIHNKGKHLKEGYNICDTTNCQVYSGFDIEKPSTNLAVDETKGILAYYNGNTIDAQYHSSSSGYTNDSISVWGGDVPYLKSVKDEYSLDSPYSSWNTTIDIKTLNEKIIKYGIDIGELKSIDILKVSSNGNVESLILIGINGKKEVKSSIFRNIVGNTDLKSTCFTIKNKEIINKTPTTIYYVMDGDKNVVTLNLKVVNLIDKDGRRKIDNNSNRAIGIDGFRDLDKNDESGNPKMSQLIIEGKGAGHGVGMSQYGAKKMAELGFCFSEILTHYYSGIDVL